MVASVALACAHAIYGYLSCSVRVRVNVVAALHVGVGANNWTCNSVILGIVRFVFYFPYLVNLACFSSWGGIFSLSQLTSGGPCQCLNSGPSSEPGVSKGLGSLFPLSGVVSAYFRFPFVMF